MTRCSHLRRDHTSRDATSVHDSHDGAVSIGLLTEDSYHMPIFELDVYFTPAP